MEKGLFEDSSSFQVSQKFDDMFGHGWRSGQMIDSGLESVLIGNPVHSQNDTIGSSEGVTSFGNSAAVFSCLTNLFLGSALFDFDAIFTFESVSHSNCYELSMTFVSYCITYSKQWKSIDFCESITDQFFLKCCTNIESYATPYGIKHSASLLNIWAGWTAI